MNRKIIVAIIFVALILFTFILDRKDAVRIPSVGVILPLEHDHLNEVATAFSMELSRLYSGKINISVKNAHQDSNLERLIVQKLVGDNVDVLVPITTKTTQMVLNTTNHTRIVSLESVINERELPISKSGR